MKWFRVVAIFAVAVGVIATQYIRRPEIKKNSGAENLNVEDRAIFNPTIEVSMPVEQPKEEKKALKLPDMKIMPPGTVYIESGGGVKKLRFDTYFINIGKGPLELRGDSDKERQVTTATQMIEKVDGGKEEVFVGEFVFHPGHNHWHVDKYAQFQIWRYNENGDLTDLLAS